MSYYTIKERIDGFGAQYQNIIFGILYTEIKLKGVYIHKKIKSMEHNYNNNPYFLENIEELMNLSEFINSEVEPKYLPNDKVYQWVEENLDYCLISETMKKIRNCFWRNKIKKEIDIAVHIRRPNIHDNRIDGVNTPDEYYLDIIKRFLKPIHIYSQGNESLFECFKKYNLHLNEELTSTFLDMVSSKIFIMSARSLSYCVALLNENNIYYLPFWHKPSVNWKIINLTNNLIEEAFHTPEPLRLNKAIVEHLGLLNLELQGKNILETGCGGRGDITKFLLSKGGIVTLNDYRLDNILFLMKTLGVELNYNTQNLNEATYDINETYDIIISYGTLYHLTYPERLLTNLSKICKEYMILCTCMNGTDNNNKNLVIETDHVHQSIDTVGCRPGKTYLVNELKKNFKFVYSLNILPNHEDFQFNYYNRIILIGSHIEINNDYFYKI